MGRKGILYLCNTTEMKVGKFVHISLFFFKYTLLGVQLQKVISADIDILKYTTTFLTWNWKSTNKPQVNRFFYNILVDSDSCEFICDDVPRFYL